VETIMETDLHSYLPGDILTKIDIASMANSLELRSPFMDHDVVSFAASLPLKYKQGFKSRKKILLDSCSDIIPKELLHRPKMGFGVPIARWLRNEWKQISTDILLNSKSVKDGFFDHQSVSDILIKHQNMKGDYSYIIWALIIFELWYEDFYTICT
jgi:asparagine synthase (glutamine-hydrolysing)